jgi:hypothetical protein
MRVPKLGLAAIAAVSGIALTGCADMYGPYGGYGGGYGYPYSGVSIGLGYGGGYGGYGSYYGGYGGGYGYGYVSPFGWYDDFYYPGTGIYVYDSYRRPRVWNDTQRRYWSQRTTTWNRDGSRWQGRDGTWSRNGTRATRENWSGFNRRSSSDTTTSGTRSDRWSHRHDSQ